ncbi:MAG: signal recognition particle-docking protein FtsY [Gemmatimonadetes bacterium]|nr:signal recognition particle-docking protein FtsY [Gemmatimonadota bacterium]
MRLWERIKAVALTDVGVLVRGLDRDALERVERVLLEADFGSASFELTGDLEAELKRGELKTPEQVRAWLTARLVGYLAGPPNPGALALGDGSGPGVILLLGVNGVGKTTQAAKLAQYLRKQEKSVLLAAADTYRAAASEQLEIWAARLNIPCVTGALGTDPAAVAFDAVESATARKIDAVVVDTAGRLHTQRDLMGEITKIAQVLGRKRPGAPHERLLVLDGTVGQNALQQGKAFTAAIPLTGLIITKLDGTAKGGAVIAIQRELGVPIRFIGVGEGVDDLEVFEPNRFVERLLSE